MRLKDLSESEYTGKLHPSVDDTREVDEQNFCYDCKLISNTLGEIENDDEADVVCPRCGSEAYVEASDEEIAKYGSVDEASPDELGSMNDKMRDTLSKVHGQDTASALAQKGAEEAERQAKAKELGDEGMEKYVQMLKSHDWTYEYSDDHSVWKRGADEKDAIRNMASILDPEMKIYKKYSPFHNEAVAEFGENNNAPQTAAHRRAMVNSYFMRRKEKEEKEQDKVKKEGAEENPYICVHAKKGKYECHAKSSYEAAKQAAKHWGLKSTAGIDAHLAVEESSNLNEHSMALLMKVVDQMKQDAEIGDYTAIDELLQDIPAERLKGYLSDVDEGHSPHKKGTAKYKKHMAAMHAGMAESSNKIVDSLRSIVDNQQRGKIRFSDGSTMVDMYTASAFVKVFDKVNDKNKENMLRMAQTRDGFANLMNKVFKIIN